MLLDYNPPHFLRLADRKIINSSLLSFIPVIILGIIAVAIYIKGSASIPPTVLGSSTIFVSTPAR